MVWPAEPIEDMMRLADVVVIAEVDAVIGGTSRAEPPEPPEPSQDREWRGQPTATSNARL